MTFYLSWLWLFTCYLFYSYYFSLIFFLHQVLQRKTEEASAAIKRLRDMIATRKAILNRSSGKKI